MSRTDPYRDRTDRDSVSSKEATTIQTGNKLHGLFMAAAERDHTDAFPANIGLSISIRGEGIFVTNMGTLSSPQTFASSGFGGQLFCVDPERELTFVPLVCGYPQLYDARKRSQRVSDLIISSVANQANCIWNRSMIHADLYSRLIWSRCRQSWLLAVEQ
jgi:hypothetical protein